MAALPQCDAFGFIYDKSGAPAAAILVILKRVEDALGNPISEAIQTTFTDSDGAYHFTLPQNAHALISARATNLNCNGLEFYVPAQDTGELAPVLPLPPPDGLVVLPPLYFDGQTLWMPRASETQDGYLSKEDFQRFMEGLPVGVTEIDTGTGLIGGPITSTGSVALADVPDLVEGLYTNPIMRVNKQGQIVEIQSGPTGGGPDTTAPVITLKPVTGIGASAATIHWDTDEFADSLVEYSINASFVPLLSASNATLQLAHTVTLSTLNSATQYHWRVISTDPSNNTSLPVVGTPFTTLAAVDVTPPVITLDPITGLVSNGAVINWHTDETADSLVEYGLSATLPYSNTTTLAHAPASTAGVTVHSIPLTSLMPGTPYHYRVKSTNAVGLPQYSADQTFTTAPPPDTTAPVISNVRSLSVLDTIATIAWDTNELSDSQVEYSTDNVTFTAAPITDAIPPGPGATAHSVGLTTLAANTQYYYRVKSKDAANNTSLPVSGTPFTTTGPAVPLLANLVSYWKMDETGTSTPRADSKGTNPFTPTVVPAVTGKLGNACQFTGTGDRLIATNNASLQTGPVDYTIAMWVQVSDIAHAGDSMSKAGGGATDEYIIGYAPGATPATTGRFRFVVQGGGSYLTRLADSFGVPLVNTWHLIIAWHNQTDGTINIQVDNGPVDSATPSPPLNAATDDLYVGDYGNGVNNYLKGLVDEVAFWKGRILDATERAEIWKGGAGKPFDTWT